jgi:hypothetical protein
VTCLVYLNRCWRAGDGGELELTPFLGTPVRIAPHMDRAVLFLSDRVMHRVLPALAPRFCFTVWIDGGAVNAPHELGLSARQLGTDDSSVAELCASPRQRAVARAVYATEYAESLGQCMLGGAGAAEMTAAHASYVEQQLAHHQLGPFVRALRARKPTGCVRDYDNDVGGGGSGCEGEEDEGGDIRQSGAQAAAAAGGGVAEKGQQLCCVACARPAVGADGSFFRCGQCAKAVYCGTDCQRLHWPTHRGRCAPVVKK